MGNIAFSFGCVNIVFIIVIFGYPAAIIGSVISSFIIAFKRYKENTYQKFINIKLFFNISQFIISITVSGYIFNLLKVEMISGINIYHIVLVALIYNFLNVSLVMFAIIFESQSISIVKSIVKDNKLYYLYSIITPSIIVFSYIDRGLLGLILIYVVLYRLQKTTQLYSKSKVQEKEIRKLYAKSKEQEKELFIDRLTGSYNYNYCQNIINHKIKKKQSFSLAMIDFDNLKIINDTYGHSIGNKILINFSEIVREKMKDKSIFCRYGGDEFILLTEDKEQLRKISIEILEKINKTPLIEKHEEGYLQVYYKVSIGVYEYNGLDNSFEDIINKADSAMYTVKKNGGNKIFEYK